MLEVGTAGSFVNEQKWKRRSSGLLYAAGAVLLGATAAGALLGAVLTDTPPLRALAAVVAVAGAVGCWYAFTQGRRLLKRAEQAAVGVRSEREVRDALRHSGSVAVAYGMMLGDRMGDCDVVVFTRTLGAAAVEVKTGHGAVSLDGPSLRVGRRLMQKSPPKQARDQARQLSRRLGNRDVLAVVCVPGMTNRPFTDSAGVWVCAKGDLAEVLDRAPRLFASAADAAETMRRLWKASQVRERAGATRPKRRPAGRSGS